MGRRLRSALLLIAGLGLAIQLVPYGPRRERPTSVREPPWDRPRTRDLFFRACKDCHSRETAWPWYGHVAPASWLLRWHVDEGRAHLDVSTWGERQEHAREAARVVRERAMPPRLYRAAHREARLSLEERRDLAAGLAATFGEEDAEGRARSHGH